MASSTLSRLILGVVIAREPKATAVISPSGSSAILIVKVPGHAVML